MEENPCRGLQKERDQAWLDWVAAILATEVASLPPTTKPLGDETLVTSQSLNPGEIKKQKAAIDTARKAENLAISKYERAHEAVLECYKRHNIPPKQRAPWVAS